MIYIFIFYMIFMSDNIETSNNNSNKLLQKSVWMYIFAFATAPLQYLVRVITSNDLDPTQMWILASVLGFMWIVWAYVDLWFREALNYYVPKFIHSNHKDKTTTIVWLSLIIQTIVWLLISILIWIFADQISLRYWKVDIWYILQVFAIYIVVSNLFSWLDGLFLIVQDVKWNKWLEFVRYLIYVLLILYIFFVWVDDKLFAYSLYPIIWTTILVIASIVVVHHRYKDVFFAGNFDLSSIQYWKIQKYSLWILFNMNLWLILSQMDIQFVYKFISPSAAWYYNNWIVITNWVLSVLSVALWVVYPIISELDAKQDHQKTNETVWLVLKYLWVAALLLWLFIWFFGEHIAVMIFGPEYAVSGLMLKYISLFLPFGLMMNAVYIILAWKGSTWDRIWWMIWGIITMWILSFLTTKVRNMWINGVALSLWLSWMTLFFLWYRSFKKVWIDHNRERWFIITNLSAALVYCILIDYFVDINTTNRLYILYYLAAIFTGYSVIMWAINYKYIISFAQELGFIKK